MGLWEKVRKGTEDGVSTVRSETTELMAKVEGLVDILSLSKILIT